MLHDALAIYRAILVTPDKCHLSRATRVRRAVEHATGARRRPDATLGREAGEGESDSQDERQPERTYTLQLFRRSALH